MTFLRVLLVAMLVTLVIYTGFAIVNDGPFFFAIAAGDVAALGWPGQFNLDFVCYLILSAIWVAWRHKFSMIGIGLGLIASVGGIIFLSIYLLIASYRANGDVREILLGEQMVSN